MSEEHCKFFVQRKKRYCKMLVKPGQEFCGEHQRVSDVSAISSIPKDSSPFTRVLCPLDPKHTVYANKLQKHLKICNARQTETKVYIEKDFNSGKNEVDVTLVTNDCFQMLSSFSKNQILTVIDKVTVLHNKYVKISDKKITHDLIEKELEKPENGNKARKHLMQVSAILGLLDEYKLLKESTCYIEFGAGRGQLSCWVAGATEDLQNTNIVLIERASPKHKRDNKLARESKSIQRVRADIADLVLDKLDIIDKVNNVTGITKHLCGEATDLAIRCLTNATAYQAKIKGAVFTFCCHHRCRWTPYTGKEFFDRNSLTMEDFNIMCGLSSWATCGTGYSREYREKLQNMDHEITKNIEESDSDLDLSRSQREHIGRMCKNVINWGRLDFLEKHDFKCLLHHYTDKDITLENVCIVAFKHKNGS